MSYEEKIVSLLSKFHDKRLLERIYKLAEYLYIYKDKTEGAE